MNEHFLYEKINNAKEFGLDTQIHEIIKNSLSRKIDLREYQLDSFKNFILYFENEKLSKNKQIHTLFHMATGSGKTIIMAGLILYLYTKGYRKFLFFVNQTNVLEKTIDNFTNSLSSKYLFKDIIEYQGNRIKIKKVDNFSINKLDDNDIEIIFTTTQKLHQDLFYPKENTITYGDFENNKVVFISDESHHINSLTKKATKDEEEEKKSWEYSVMNSFSQNKDNIMLEFTATCDLKDNNVLNKYKDKIVFNYPLISFRESGYTKDFQNFATDTDLWTRALIALVMSEYRKFLFADLKLNIKPVVMLKSQKIVESENFYNEFFKKMNDLTIEKLNQLENVEIEILNKAIKYFKDKDNSLEILLQSIKNSFTKETSIIMNGSTDNNKENQLLVNSLEDEDNPIRLIFAVDMLNEGWDVLNLFDIVRLYDTRQGSGKPGKIGVYTIKEAQLIGRGARYCPFIDDDQDLKFKRKYDTNLENKNRILETMFFHSKNDSSYISELKQALIETGLQAPAPITIEYKLKEDFKNSDFYRKCLVYSNTKKVKDRYTISSLEPSMKTKNYHYTAFSGKGNIFDLIGDEKEKKNYKTNIKIIKFKDIEENILLGTSEYFEELKFNVLKEKYPSLKTKLEFFTSDDFLGNSTLEITYTDKIKGRDLFLAVKKAYVSISSYISSIKQEYVGSVEFVPRKLNDVLKDKKIYLSNIENNGGKGNSQTNCINEEYILDLSDKNWYVFNDNFGTSEEKLFLRYFETTIKPKLDEKNLEYYVIRNERIPEFAIYSFEAGERFEPDFLLFIRKKQVDNTTITYQGYIEPKGEHLINQNIWKEDFSLQIEETGLTTGVFSENYKILGFPFFNKKENIKKFEDAIIEFINKI